LDEKRNEETTDKNRQNQFNRKPRSNKGFGRSKETRSTKEFRDHRGFKGNKGPRGNKGLRGKKQFRDNREFRGSKEFDRTSHGPRNIRFGTKFCGECRACNFWVEPKIGKYRCENSYLPFEIVEIRRDHDSNITEIVINLLV